MRIIKIISTFVFLLLYTSAFTQPWYIQKNASLTNASKLYEYNGKMAIVNVLPAVGSNPLLTAKLTIDASDLTTIPALKIISGNALALSVNNGITAGTIESTGSLSGWHLWINGTNSMGYSISTIGRINVGSNSSQPSTFNGKVSFLDAASFTEASFTNVNIGNSTAPGVLRSKSVDYCVISGLQNKGGGVFIDKPVLQYKSDVIESLSLFKVMSGFQMENNAGLNKVLTSNATGVGTWADLNTLIDKTWIRTTSNNIYSNCNFVGIGTGTSNPIKELEIRGSMALSGKIYGSSITNHSLDIWGGTGTNSGILALGDGTTNQHGIKLVAPASDGEIQFWISNKTGTSMVIRNTEVVLGNPDNVVDLKINGKAYAMEMKVSLDRWWDEVFNQEYKLMPLEELKSFVSLNKHLPEIPAQKEVLENGINIGEMNALLLKKIEELTLYVIDQQKQIDELKKSISK